MNILLIVTAILAQPEGSNVSSALTAQEIMERVHQVTYAQATDFVAEVELEIFEDGRPRPRRRLFAALRLNVSSETEQRFYVYLRQPSDLEGMIFVTWKHEDSTDDRWLCLSSQDIVQRLPVKDDRSSFVNSDFFYQDLTGRPPERDKHELVRQTDDYHVVRSVPGNDPYAEFEFYETWVHRDSFLPVQISYTKSGEIYRTIKVLEVQTIQSYPTITKVEVSDQNSGNRSVMTYQNVSYDVGLNAEVFSERYFNAPPDVVRR